MGSGIAVEVNDDPAWPPGTVRLERLLNTDSNSSEIILQPRPTSDPNDPLNWPKWRKYLNFGLATFYALMAFAQINATTPTWGPMEDELGFDATLMYVVQVTCTQLTPCANSRAIGTIHMLLEVQLSPWEASC